LNPPHSGLQHCARSVIKLLTFTSTVIPGSSLLKLREKAAEMCFPALALQWPTLVKLFRFQTPCHNMISEDQRILLDI
jgi:hypothetical protein